MDSLLTHADFLLLTPDAAIADYIETEIKSHVRETILSVKSEVEASVREIMSQEITSSETYQSLLGGRLQYEFGLRDPKGDLDAILAKILESVQMDYVPPAADLGGMSVTAIEADYKDIIPLGTYISQSKQRGTATPIPWLDWLLTEGNAPVASYELVTKGGYFGGTRTLRAVMVRSSRQYSVSEPFAGTPSDNWFTRLVDDKLGEATLKIMQRALEEAF